MVRICETLFPVESSYNNHFSRFPYPLSDFQKYSIKAIVDGDHSLVSAPTGSGKTLPAEFAIEHFVKNGKKVIYTSPIKALSNQKFHEFSHKFPDISIGLITGDIKTNTDASVLIMTTEILMNYLFAYTSSDPLVRTSNLQFNIDIGEDLACVIFDEVHYINDASRGENWEKTILMLPSHVQMIMLSATLNNKEEFAEWCESNSSSEGKQVILSSTSTRVVPLSHYAFIASTEDIFKGMTDKVLIKQIRDNTNIIIPLKIAPDTSAFNELNYIRVAKTLHNTRHVFMKRKHVLNSLSLYLKSNDMLPALAFVFSRKNVETCAREITINLLEDDSKIPYTMRDECDKIVRKLPNFKEYLELPEYNTLISLLEKGIGIHHSGMISILREIVEIMISRNCIKLLFATESFAIGLDCAIKTTIMTGVSKFDGSQHRMLFPHEYTQAAGRAGRRGRDLIGNVVHCNNLFPIPSLLEYKTLLSVKSQSLVSKFRFSYSLVINLVNNGRTEMTDFVEFVKKSMTYIELMAEIKTQKKIVVDIEKIVGVNPTFFRTPNDVCLRFLELCHNLPKTKNKQRRSIEKELEDIQTTHKFISQDSNIVSSRKEMINNLDIEFAHLVYLETFVNTSIENVCMVLTSNDFLKIYQSPESILQPESTSRFIFTRKGIIAAGLAEVHSLVGAECVFKWNFFSEFSSKQIMVILSAFSDVKIRDDIRSHSSDTGDIIVDIHINEISKIFIKYEHIETELGMRTGIDYTSPVNFDIPNYMAEWWECKDEISCKIFLQTKLPEKEISVGDFVKAVLKISSIIREMSGVAEKCGEINFLKKLSLIDVEMLKYIVSCQSLYV